MSEMDENLTVEQSLDIITKMIRQAQGRFSGNSFYFILWGWCVVAANLGMYVLMRFSDYPYPYLVWLITVPAWIITLVYAFGRDRRGNTRSHLDQVNLWLWLSLGISMFIVCSFGYVIAWNLNPVILLMGAIPTFVSGMIIRFKPLLIGGISFWIGGLICFLVPHQEQYLVGAIAIAFGYLWPGYLLKKLRNSVDV